MSKLSCREARQIDIVDYLYSLGFQYQKKRGADYWYLSPLREERTASFKVDRNKNLWYDHGTGEGGNIIDFGTRYFKCPVAEFLKGLSVGSLNRSFSFHPPSIHGTMPHQSAGEKKTNNFGKIIIKATRTLNDARLLNYLESRCIPLEIANKYCREVDFELYGKKHTVIGFPCDKGGFELRSASFKGSSSPKSTTFFERGSDEVDVFEGFFDFLSFQALHRDSPGATTNSMVLNSLSFFAQSRPLMEKHRTVGLYLDRNKKGIECTNLALQWDGKKYKDLGKMLREGQDMNEWFIEKQSRANKDPIVKNMAQHHGKGRRIR